MKTYYKILKLASEVMKPETENAPINYFLFFGPPFRSKAAAKSWLKKNSASRSEYAISRLYALSLPEGLRLKKKNQKIIRPGSVNKSSKAARVKTADQ